MMSQYVKKWSCNYYLINLHPGVGSGGVMRGGVGGEHWAGTPTGTGTGTAVQEELVPRYYISSEGELSTRCQD